MFKKLNNWHLSILIAFVSIVSIALIQQYVWAQSNWVDPNSLPGVTPQHTFLLNPLAADLNMNFHKIIGDGGVNPNLIFDAAGTNAITVDNGKYICFNGSCLDAWPSVDGGVIASSTTENYIPKFGPLYDGTRIVTNSRLKWDSVNSIMKLSEAPGQNVLQIGDRGRSDTSGQLIVEGNSGNSGKPFILLRNNPTFPGSGPDFIKIDNSDTGYGINLIQNSTNALAKDAIRVTNTSVGNSLYITSSGIPFVINSQGRVGIGTATPNKQLHVKTTSGNAELDIQSGTDNIHWGIYQNQSDGALRFWKTDNLVTFLGNGNVGIGTSTPQSKLEVLGTGKFDGILADGSVSANTLLAGKGFMTELSVSALTAEDGLTINTPSITMNSTSGDSCVVEMISDRNISSTSGGGHFNIVCYAPINVCGNNIVEPANGEECDPVGKVRYDYDITEPGLYDCSAKSTFVRAKITCQTSCQEQPTTPQDAVCQCQFRCIAEEPPHQEYYVIDYCSTPGPTACAVGGI